MLEEKREQQSKEEEGEDSLEAEPHPMEEEAAEPEEEAKPTVDFAKEDIMADYEVAQATEIAEKSTILESIHDDAYVEANRRFIR